MTKVVCRTCERAKPLEEFYVRSDGNRHTECIGCYRGAQANRYQRSAGSQRQSPAMLRLEDIHGMPLRDLLIQLYYDDGLTYAGIARRLKVPRSTIGKWFRTLGVNARDLARQAHWVHP